MNSSVVSVAGCIIFCLCECMVINLNAVAARLLDRQRFDMFLKIFSILC